MVMIYYTLKGALTMTGNLEGGLNNLLTQTKEIEEGIHSWNVTFSTLKGVAILRQKAKDAEENEIFYKCQDLEERIEHFIKASLKK
jgi:hypothetical protein